MKNYFAVGVVIAVMVIYWGGTVWYRRRLAGQITDAMTKGDLETYEKLLFSKRAMYFLNPNGLCLMRSSAALSNGNLEEAKKNLKVVRVKKLNFEQKVNYFQVKSMLAMQEKDKEMHKEIEQELSQWQDDAHAEMIKALLEENRINQKLYFDYDVSVIEDLKKQLDKSEGPAYGMICMSLAKAYHLNHDEENSSAFLKKAKEILKGSLYEELIEATEKDHSLMD